MAYTGPTYKPPFLTIGDAAKAAREDVTQKALSGGPLTKMEQQWADQLLAPIDQGAINEWNTYLASQFPDGIPKSAPGQWSHVPGLMRDVQNAIDQGYGTSAGQIREVMRLAPMISDPARSHSVAGVLPGRGPGVTGFGITHTDAQRAGHLGLPEQTVADARAWSAVNPFPPP